MIDGLILWLIIASIAMMCERPRRAIGRGIIRLSCWFGCCMQCRTHSTDEGIGGKCINCGEIHGWVTREELRAYRDGV